MTRSKKTEAIAAMRALIADHEAREEPLPNDGAALLLGEVLLRADLSRNHLSRYPDIRSALSEHASRFGLAVSREGHVREDEAKEASSADANLVDARLLRDARRRITALETRCAELRAENARLRTRTLRDVHTAELIAAGGRVSSR